MVLTQVLGHGRWSRPSSNPAGLANALPPKTATAKNLAAEQPFIFESRAVIRLPGFAPNTQHGAGGRLDGWVMLATKPDSHDSHSPSIEAQNRRDRFSFDPFGAAWRLGARQAQQ